MSTTPLSEADLRPLIFGADGSRRFTQDSPVLPEVWWRFGRDPGEPAPVLLTPHRLTSTSGLVRAVRDRITLLGASPDDRHWGLAHNESHVTGQFTFPELFLVLLPLTGWYQQYLWRGGPISAGAVAAAADLLTEALRAVPGSERDSGPLPADLVWLARIAGTIEWARAGGPPLPPPADAAAPAEDRVPAPRQIADAFIKLLEATPPVDQHAPPVLWQISLRRTGTLALWRSRETVKADVAERSFNLNYGGLRWVIVDTGIDATHPAFRRRDPSGRPYDAPFVQQDGAWVNQTRLVESYDFTRLAPLLQATPDDDLFKNLGPDQANALQQVQQAHRGGQRMPWDLLRPLLQVPHDDHYRPPAPENHHGTHVAGILAGDWRTTDPGAADQAHLTHDLRGVCPGLELIDIRVFNDELASDEFTFISALQFIRFLNSHANQPVIQGCNISISFPANPVNFAAGRTPACDECDRLTGSGVITVVAAGNTGYQELLSLGSTLPVPSFAAISITDPGTTESVITVGSTHREHPHAYGVSYFSARGPTADGRRKPDLLGPGEKVTAPVPGQGFMAKDGTSMAAPHVSGAVAVLLARYPEFIGQPEKVKRILMATATDLGRDPNFQGAGLVDIMRALQSV